VLVVDDEFGRQPFNNTRRHPGRDTHTGRSVRGSPVRVVKHGVVHGSTDEHGIARPRNRFTFTIPSDDSAI